MTLSNILQFFSGSSKIPAAGFDGFHKIYFTDDDVLPWASTCDLSITFPRTMGLLTEDEFRRRWICASLAHLDLVQFKLTLSHAINFFLPSECAVYF